MKAVTQERSPISGRNLSDETLSRAILTYCIDSPDAILYATLLGAQHTQGVQNTHGAQALLEALDRVPVESHSQAGHGSTSLNTLDEMFITGSARWGRRTRADDLKKFHRSLKKWRTRLATLPFHQRSQLQAWLTHDGAYWLIDPNDELWPQQLDDLAIRSDWAPPLCLWGRGDARALVSCPQPVAIVGSRLCDDYGRFVAHQAGQVVASQGHLVVSGGALGADASAHWGALAAQQEGYENLAGRTVAVFAGGLDHIGPRRNDQLFAAMSAHGGAFISELPPETIPEGRRFLLRNRLIAALANTVVVSQARYRSGALNTANWANELGRIVYAAPGSIESPENTGCNKLIYDGKAILLLSTGTLQELTHDSHDPYLGQDLDRQPSQAAQEPLEPAEPCGTDQAADREQARSVPSQAVAAGVTTRQQHILRAIESCRKQRIEASCENVYQLVKAMPDGECEFSELLATAGSMELEGLITVDQEVLKTVTTHEKSATGRQG